MIVALAAVVVLQPGQVRWFMPGALRPGRVVACAGMTTHVPATGSTDFAWRNGTRISIAGRHGAYAVACNASLPSPPWTDMPYVIGQNGLALIRGKNTLAELVSRFGPAARWRAIGLIVTFRRGVLVRASVTGHRWTTLTGARVGDPLAELIWRIGGRRVAGGWLVATGAQYHSRLVARIRNGRVTGFVATLG